MIRLGNSIAVTVTLLISAGVGQAQEGRILEDEGSFRNSFGPITRFQTASSNIIGLVQTGPDWDQSTLIQRGEYNRIAVIQSAHDKVALVDQLGAYNRSLLIQISDAVTDTAAIRQIQGEVGSDAVNFSIQRQTVVDDSDPVTRELLKLEPDQWEGVTRNFLFAPETVRAHPEMINIASQQFLDNLVLRFDTSRWGTCGHSLSDPGHDTPAPGTEPMASKPKSIGCQPMTAFATGGHLRGERRARLGILDYDYDGAFGLIGWQVQPTHSLQLGLAFQYSDLDLGFAADPTDVDIDVAHVGIFGLFSDDDWFLGGALIAGHADLDIDRTDSGLSAVARPDATTYGVALRGGYLHQPGKLRLGPLANLQYTRATVDSYQESGNILVTQSVSKQRDEMLTLNGGGQVGYRAEYHNMSFDVYFIALLEHEFDIDDNLDVIQTEFGLSPGNKLLTPFEDAVDRTYGRLSGGLTISTDAGLTFSAIASGIVGNSERDAFNIGASLSINF